MLKSTIAWLSRIFLELRENPPLVPTREKQKLDVWKDLIYTEIYSRDRDFIFPKDKDMR